MVSWGVGSNFAYKAWVFLEPYILNDVARIIVPMIVMKTHKYCTKTLKETNTLGGNTSHSVRLRFWQSNQCPHFPTHWMGRLLSYEKGTSQKNYPHSKKLVKIEKFKKILVISITNLWSINLQEGLSLFFNCWVNFIKNLKLFHYTFQLLLVPCWNHFASMRTSCWEHSSWSKLSSIPSFKLQFVRHNDKKG
jgi:hypothetical protein